jgi:hypothetical protein
MDKQNYLPFYILIRTSKRPKFFAAMMESIKKQTYPNIKTIVHTDDPGDTYVTGDMIIKGDRVPKGHKGHAPYNLYNNRLLQAIPQGDGWYHFIDDDDKYAAPDVIEKSVAKCKEKQINIVRSKRWSGSIWPKTWGSQTSFQTECFILHTKHKNIASWWDKTGGDHHYSKQITKQLQINWIDGIIICEAQEGKGHGDRFDLGQAKHAGVNIDSGLPIPDKALVDVLFCIRVRFPQECKGFEGEVKKVPMWRAVAMEAQKKVIIDPTLEQIAEVREALKRRPPLSEARWNYLYKKKSKKFLIY